MKNVIGSIFILVLLISNRALADTTEKLPVAAMSAWTNELGSTLYIDAISPSGQLTGHYINRARGYGCQNIPYPVTGWIYGTAITFTTLWRSSTQSCNSITSWAGFYYQGKISTLWQLTINGSTSTSQILQGSDTFKQTGATESKSLLQD